MSKKATGIAVLSVLILLAVFLIVFALGEPSSICTMGGIVAGFLAWCFPIGQLVLAKKQHTALCAAASLTFGMICLLLEFSYLVHKAKIGDWAAIEDTAAALLAAAAIYTAITVGLNIIMLVAAKLKERIS